MTPLHKYAAFIQGVRQELLANGFSEADALVLSKRANYEKLAQSHPDDFYSGYFNRLQIENITKPRKRRLISLDDIIRALPYIAGAGALYAFFGTPWGKRRQEEIARIPQDFKEKHDRQASKPITYTNESKDTDKTSKS